jgi:hypothetical protein
VANDSKKSEEEESGEFADFMADISEEIAHRVESLDSTPDAPEPSLKELDAKLMAPGAKPKAPEPKLKAPEAKPKAPEAKPKVAAEQVRRTPAPVDAGVIVEWPNIADRMIEEVR